MKVDSKTEVIEIDLKEFPRETLEQIILISAETDLSTEKVIVDLIYRAVEKLNSTI